MDEIPQETDQFAITSYSRALEAQRTEAFEDEIIPVRVDQGRQVIEVTEDEELARFDANKIASLKPIFREGGTVTAANASAISDGAAASENQMRRLRCRPVRDQRGLFHRRGVASLCIGGGEAVAMMVERIEP